ncbi:hypothetical protein [Streptomyces sp. NPDC057257]|uniref:hypothetical protein n=1 Tax=Streptomyces sp. NPDC057257 TaxID=3346071 RepID=UPI003637F163
MTWRRPAWLTMNVWTVTFGIATLALTGLGIYINYLGTHSSAKQAPTGYSITVPGDAERIGLCLHSVRGAGQVPKDGSLWLVVHGVGNRGYYLSRQVQPDASGDGWAIGSLQVGNTATAEGQQYELILWRLDSRVTDVVNHVFTTEGLPVFVGPPQGVTTVAHTTVVRTTDKHPCS